MLLCNGTVPPQPSTPQFSLGVLVLLALLMVLLALVTILGNVLVILAFILDKNLRHRNNYFFLNLAISDFAVGKLQWEACNVCFPILLGGSWVSSVGVWFLLRELFPSCVAWGRVRNDGNCVKCFSSLLCLKMHHNEILKVSFFI